MKKLILLLFMAASFTGFGQYYQADPGIGQPFLVDASGNSVNANTLTPGQVAKLRLSVYNGDVFTTIPSNDTRLQISLGQNLQLVNAATVGTAPLNNLFAWTVTTTSTGQQISGVQIADIPGNYTGFAEFDVTVVGNTPASGSFVVANWFITNQNSTQVLGDYNSNNNASNLNYFTTVLLPVKFVSLDLNNVNCTVNVSWKVAEENGVDHYEVLASNNAAMRMITATQANSANGGAYNASFAIPENLKGQVLFVQVKEVDQNGAVTLSNIKTVRGTCDASNRPLVVYVYPNPVTSTNFVNIGAKEGVFNGKYKLELIDNSGKLYQVKEAQLSNVTSVPFEFKTALAPGNYIIRISNMDGSQTSSVQFIKVGIL
jgi:hypothetical protein